MSGTKTISDQLRKQFHDLAALYEEAKASENTPLMEKLSRSVATLAKQIKEQETYERETLNRSEVKELGQLTGSMLGRVLRQYLDESMANTVIELYNFNFEEMLENA